MLKVIAVAFPDGPQVPERAHRGVGLLGAVNDPGLVALRSSIKALGPDPDQPVVVA